MFLKIAVICLIIYILYRIIYILYRFIKYSVIWYRGGFSCGIHKIKYLIKQLELICICIIIFYVIELIGKSFS
jgi:hypothetical protein